MTRKEAYEKALEEAKGEFDELQPQYTKLGERIRDLRHTIKGLSGLLNVVLDEEKHWYPPRDMSQHRSRNNVQTRR